MSEIICKVCEEGIYILKEKLEEFCHNDQKECLFMLSYECTVCKCCYTTNEQSKLNKQTVLDFRLRCDLLAGYI